VGDFSCFPPVLLVHLTHYYSFFTDGLISWMFALFLHTLFVVDLRAFTLQVYGSKEFSSFGVLLLFGVVPPFPYEPSSSASALSCTDFCSHVRRGPLSANVQPLRHDLSPPLCSQLITKFPPLQNHWDHSLLLKVSPTRALGPLCCEKVALILKPLRREFQREPSRFPS